MAFINQIVINFKSNHNSSRSRICSSSQDTEKEFSNEFNIPGKFKISEADMKKREKDLKALANKWKKERILKEDQERKLIGFTKNSEIINGRMAMIFLVTGILTEYWTEQTIPNQIDTMLRVAGLL
jgi:hypothetical protein